MKILNLHGHHLIVIDQGRFLFLIDLDLFNQILSRRSLAILLAHGTGCPLDHRQTLIGLNELALGIDDHGLELVALSEQLLRIAVDLLLQVEVLAQEGVPLALAGSFPTLVLL